MASPHGGNQVRSGLPWGTIWGAVGAVAALIAIPVSCHSASGGPAAAPSPPSAAPVLPTAVPSAAPSAAPPADPATPGPETGDPPSGQGEGSDGSDGSAATPAPRAGAPVPMSSLKIVDDGSVSEWAYSDTSEIKGKIYRSTLWTCADLRHGNWLNCAHSKETSYAEIALSGKFTTFTATLGFSDKSPSDCRANVVTLRDGSPEQAVDLGFTDTVPISLDVAGVQRLRFEVNFITGGTCYLDYGGATVTNA